MSAATHLGRRWFAQDCPLCGSESDDELVCAGCAADLPALPEHCPQCALPSPRGAVCGNCVNHPPRFDRTVALWRYDFPCDALVHALKYGGRIALAGFFARSLSRRGLQAVDLVVPIPLHPKRLAERGFNQALEIARELARCDEVVVASKGLRRVKDTLPQTGLPLERRATNVRGAFECDLDLSNKSVAVVDDVMTTGATLDELARVLKRAGAVRVENWVVARAVLR